MTASDILPMPDSTYQLLLEATRAWPQNRATHWIPDPGDPVGRVTRTYLDTGNLGRVDADGFVYLTGRAKNLIIRGGHNIDPRVIEEGLLSHAGVTGAVAVGRPDRHSGEVPVAYVVPVKPASFDEAELLTWAATTIGEPAARPKRIYPIDAIPVTAIGKHYKPALAADAAVRAVTKRWPGPACRALRRPPATRKGSSSSP